MTAFAIDVNVKDFEQKVITASRRVPVIVDFWAPWCGPCRALGPILEKLAAEYQGRFILAKVNSDENQELAMRYGVRGIPNVKAFVDGALADEFTGALPESAVREFIENLLPSPAEPLRQQALAANARGDTAAAQKLLAHAVQLDPRNEAARLDLVELFVSAGDLEEARRLLDELGDRVRETARADALRARLALAGASAAQASQPELEARVAADPADLAARLDLANLLAVREDYRPALEQLLEIVRRDRSFGDDAGRRTMLTLFNLLGSDHELVREFRRELAAELNR
jgi:putative thioredoxin